ncbi:hypothetical protein LCGC14_0895790 [marine sediment metagenome]|uniref:RNA ligase domain-containing protein n=1 Tax=marine sediment metagenome TaxID=412755 RepID=A0A0F9PIR0_9ZZZZ
MKKPLGRKSYGSIPHLPGSRRGPGDHGCDVGTASIATEKTRDKHDTVIVQEKLDGSNVGVCKVNGEIIALGRAGYRAGTSPYEQHRMFAAWVGRNSERFSGLLNEGERVCGEWLAQAHGTRYDLPHEPFVAFDIMTGTSRVIYDELVVRTHRHGFIKPFTIHCLPEAYAIERAMKVVQRANVHGAIDPVEGCVWRVERNRLIDKHSGKRKPVVDFLVKYVRPDKIDGCYLPDVSGKEAVWNWRP